MLKAISTTFILLLFTFPFFVSAHGIWFAERSSQLAFIYGEGADDLNVLKRQHKIENVQAFNQNWRPVNATLEANGPLLTVDTKQTFSAITAVLNNGIWSKTHDNKWVAKGRNQVPNAQLSERTYKYAVHLTGPLQTIPPIKKQVLQIIPMGEKYPLTRNETVYYTVLFKGKPITGASLINDFINDPDAKPVRSNDKGIVKMKIRNQGLNVLAAIYDEKIEHSNVIDKIEHLATLSFVLPHEEE